MAVWQWLKQIVKYLEKGTARLFSPSEDNYPKIGIQPFEDEPYDENQQSF